MKLKTNNKLKIGLIPILILLIGLTSFLLYKEIKHPGFYEQKTSLYNYNSKGTVGYKVFLKPNILYDTNSLEEGNLYITEFVDNIEATFNYEFSADRKSDLKGTYDIIAKVQGSTKEGEKVLNIWEKNFIIIDQKSFNANDNTKSINEEVIIKLDEYNEFVKKIVDTSRINCQTSLSLIMNIDIDGNIEDKQIEENISPSIVIPLNTNMFQISGNTNIEKPGAIEEIKQVQLPVNKNRVIIYSIILGVLLIALIFLIFFTEAIVIVKDPYEKKLKQIFKKHGDRLVALNDEPTVISERINKVKSIDDLVRIADEIGKPILYKHSANYKEISKFYVTNEDEVYILNLNEVEELMDKIKEFKSKSLEDNKEESKIES